jgi:hypothetical protein
MAGPKKDPGVMLRIPHELYERITAWSAETGRSINELLLDAVQRSFLAWPDGLTTPTPSKNDRQLRGLQQENERLQQQVQSLLEERRALHPEDKPTPTPIVPRRVPPEEQKKALIEAQKRLEELRMQRVSQQPRQLPTPKPAELERLKEIEAHMFQVATEMVSPQSELLDQRREQARRGRLEGIAYEESDSFSRHREEKPVTRPSHVKVTLQKKTAEISSRQPKK